MMLLLAAQVTAQQASPSLKLDRVSFGESVAPVYRRKPYVAYDDVNKRLFLFGGQLPGEEEANEANRTIAGSETYVFQFNSSDNLQGNWTKIEPEGEKPASRFYGQSGMVGRAFTIAMGEDPNKGTFYNDAWALEETDEGTYKWKLVSPKDDDGEQPRERYGAVSAIYDGKLCIGYGFAKARFSDMFCLDNGKWEKIYGGNSQYDLNNAHARCLGAGSNLGGNKLLMYGGCLSSGFAGGPCGAKDTWEWDFKAKNWTRATDHPVPTVHTSMAYFTDDLALQYGGDDNFRGQRISGQKLNESVAFLYSSKAKGWAAVNLALTNGPKRRLKYHDMVRINAKQILVVGGEEKEDGEEEVDGRMQLYVITREDVPSNVAWNDHKGITTYFSVLELHGIFMFLGWGFFIQIGSYVWRYWRHKSWAFKVHRMMNSIGLLFALVGLILVFAVGGSPIFLHGIIGLLVMLAGLMQPLNAAFRCHKPDKDGVSAPNACCGLDWTHRWKFNMIHHVLGRFALVFGIINISLGFPLLLVERIELWYSLWFVFVAIIVLVYFVSEIMVRTGKIPKIVRTPEERYLPCSKKEPEMEE